MNSHNAMSTKFLVIKTGRTYDNIRAQHGCFEDWMIAALGAEYDDVTVVSVFEGEALPENLDDFDGVVITGSPAMVTEKLPWSEAVARWLAQAIVERKSRVPVIGICYGHQLLAHALGGVVDYNPRGREIGTVEVRVTDAHTDDPLFGGHGTAFSAHVTHLQSVLQLPPGAVHLASSDLEAHQAFRYGENVWGVQFHPEFNDRIMHAYVEVLGEKLRREGLEPAQVRAGIHPAGNGLLHRFAQHARRRRARHT